MGGDGKRVVLMTASGPEEAERIARGLVEGKLAACVNIVPQIRSVYQWEGKVCDDPETLLIAKTSVDKVAALIEKVKCLHSYDVPEIISLGIEEGSEAYLAWMGDVLR